jgi:hypothetical protein
MAFQGSLAELHLPDIIQLVSVSGKTGVFHLIDGHLKGQIYLHEGRIVHATLDDVSGEEAVYALAIWNKGDFKFEPAAPSEIKTISKSNTNLLMEAARRLDEWRVLVKKIPATEMIPEFVVQDSREGQISLNTGEWLILSKIDGQRSIKGIAGASGLSVFDTSKILYSLIVSGLIRLREATMAPAAGAAGAPAGAPRPAGSDVLNRLNRVRDVCNSTLGAVGESVVNKHYQKARGDIEKGAGGEAVDEAINQITRAAAILKGAATTETLLEQLKGIR